MRIRALAVLPCLLVSGLVWAGSDDLTPLTDEFDDSSTLSEWARVHEVEQWNANQLEEWDIDDSQPGWMTMVPYTSSWYENYRGVLAFKLVTGDFIFSTRVRPRRRDGSPGAPQSQYSLAGIMVRAPRNITPQTWTPGGENYVFLSMGAAGDPGVYQFEVKTTENSVSDLQYENIEATETEIRVARIGSHIIVLRRVPGADWTIHRRYLRDDFPDTLQAGLTCYTDWPNVQGLDPFVHNGTVITEGNPDLRAEFDYVRYARPAVPPALEGAELSNPGMVSDGELLAFLGDAADLTPTATPSATESPTSEVLTETQTATLTSNPTSTATPTPSVTETETPTASQTPTSTPSQTPSETIFLSHTSTPSETAESSPSETPSLSETPSPTEASFPSPTASPTEDFDFDDDLDVDAADLVQLLGNFSPEEAAINSLFGFSLEWHGSQSKEAAR